MTSGQAILRRHGRSFHWASRLLRPDQAQALADLYGICRQVDDLADEATDPQEAAQILEDLAWATRHSAVSPHPLVANITRLHDSHGVSRAAMAHLIEGVRQDLEPVAIADLVALRRYAYAVAGTVGLMVCDVLGVDDAAARPHAIDLGLAMQMTNIARDVAADAAMGRVYLPAEWIEGASAADIRAAAADRHHPLRPTLAAAVLRLLELADVHYTSGRQGLGALPANARLGIRTAALVYRAIGTRLRWVKGDALCGRATTSGIAKIGLTLRAVVQHGWGTMADRSANHDPALHQGLAGLPGANA